MKATTAHGRLFYLVLLVSAGLSFWIVVAGLFALAIGTMTSSTARAQDAPVASTAEGTWTLTGDLTSPRHGGTATLLHDGRVVLAGGDAGVAVDRVELYDPATGTWRATGPLVTGRTAHSATLLPDGRVLVVGGYDVFGQPLRSAELYDPVLGLWSPTGSLGSVRARHGATLLESGKVLVVAGVALVDTTGSAELYDPTTGAWRSTGGLEQGRIAHTTTLLEDGTVLVTGGRTSLRFNPSYELTRSAERYDPATGAWTAIADLPQVRAGHSATLLASGNVLVAGGLTSDGEHLGSVLLFDPGSGQWRSGGNLETARHAHTATRLANGNVLVVGGAYTDTVELYDSDRGIWKRGASINVARVEPTATLLSDGKVLATGSPIYDDFFFSDIVDPSALSTELYTPAGAIDAGHTGAWFDPAQSGHGIVLEVLPDRRVHAQWFTFNPTGDQQAWFGGTGTYSGNVATIDNVVLPTGGRWIPNFDPATVVLNPLGTLTLTFSDHDHGRAEFSLGRGYGTGTMNLVRLTSLAQPASVVPAGSETIGAGHSGSWFDPAQGGHGLMIEVLPDNQLFAAWFTYNPAGTQQAWFTGVGTYAGNRATISAIQPTNGRWIPNFDQSSVAINPWGTLTITFQDCTHGRVDFDSVRGYGSGSMTLARLTMPAGVACP